MDDKSLKLLERFSGRKILAVGTMGSYPDSVYGKRVYKNVEALINAKNICQGIFLCQGKIETSRTEKRRALPKDDPHYLNDESYQRHLESRKHPNDIDLKAAADFVVKSVPDI